MSQIKRKFIRFGTGTDDVNSQNIPANFTPSNYTPSQVGSEGTDKVSANLKGIDDKFGTIPAAVTGDINQTSFSAANNQASAANVTGFSFANASVRSFEALVSVSIDATSDLYAQFKIFGIQKSSSWEITTSYVGDDTGIVFTITNAGQIQYTSTNITGFTSNAMRFRAQVTSV